VSCSSNNLTSFIKFKLNWYCLPQFFTAEGIKNYYNLVACDVLENSLRAFDSRFKEIVKRDVFDVKFTAMLQELDIVLKDRFTDDLVAAKLLFEQRKDRLSLELQSQIKDLIGYVEQKLKSTDRLCRSALVEKSYKIRTPTSTPEASPSSETIFRGSEGAGLVQAQLNIAEFIS
jgi:hypothetical protein